MRQLELKYMRVAWMWIFPVKNEAHQDDSVDSWTCNTKPHGWFNQVRMLRAFSQAMDMELPVPSTNRRRLSKLASYACVRSTTAPKYKSWGHPYDRIIQSVNVFEFVSETRMQLRPARESHEWDSRTVFTSGILERYLQVLFSSFVPDISLFGKIAIDNSRR